MARNRTYKPGDDTMWVSQDVAWNSDPQDPSPDIRSMIINPHQWVADLKDDQGRDLGLILLPTFFMHFKRADTSQPGSNVVQGIHKTGLLTIQATKAPAVTAPFLDWIKNFNNNMSPLIQIILDHQGAEEGQSFGIAYVHLQIVGEGSRREVIADYIQTALESFEKHAETLTAWCEARRTLNFVTKPRGATEESPVVFKIDPGFVLFHEGEQISVAPTQQETLEDDVPACDALLGTYRILPNGQIEIIVNTSFIKRYAE